MSGLVTGLQNRAQRFESASDLNIFQGASKFFLKHLVILAFALISLDINDIECYSIHFGSSHFGVNIWL